ncbi:MAG: lytic transglycosylase domain-containing protein [Burkholderiales bacterium]
MRIERVLAALLAGGVCSGLQAAETPYRLTLPAPQDFRVQTDAPYRLAAPWRRPMAEKPVPAPAADLGDKPHAEAIDSAARKTALDPALLHAVIHVESRHRDNALSPKGAQGLMQVMPATAARYGITDAGTSPRANLKAGTLYLRTLMERFNARLDLVLAAYNAGEGAVQRHANRIPPYPETRQYVRDVLSKYEEWRAPADEMPANGATPAIEYLPGTRLILPAAGAQ